MTPLTWKAVYLVACFGLGRFSWADSVICAPGSSKTALIIIDMQDDFVKRYGYDKDSENQRKVKEVKRNQKRLIDVAKASNMPIVFIRHEGEYGMFGQYKFGSVSKDLLATTQGYNNFREFPKTADGMFSKENKHRGDLIGYLRTNHVGRLIVAGANGGSCVKASVEGAIDGNCSVEAYTPGIADFNKESFVFPYDDFSSFKIGECIDCSFVSSESLPTTSKGSQVNSNAETAR